MTEQYDGVEFAVPMGARHAEVLTPEAMAFTVGLQRTFNQRRKDSLAARVAPEEARCGRAAGFPGVNQKDS